MAGRPVRPGNSRVPSPATTRIKRIEIAPAHTASSGGPIRISGRRGGEMTIAPRVAERSTNPTSVAAACVFAYLPPFIGDVELRPGRIMFRADDSWLGPVLLLDRYNNVIAIRHATRVRGSDDLWQCRLTPRLQHCLGKIIVSTA
jgi:hypothetical protein